jgi:hypothetical protein
MFRSCAPSSGTACSSTRRAGKKAPLARAPEWALGFEQFRAEHAHETEEDARAAWEAQKLAMIQEDEVAARLYAEMDLIEGAGGTRLGASASAAAREHQELVSEGIRRALREELRERAKRADANPFAVVAETMSAETIRNKSDSELAEYGLKRRENRVSHNEDE